MIIFDLRCTAAGHVFEAWFGSSADYDDQRARGLVSCPICGDAGIEKAPMAPAVPKKGSSATRAPDLLSGGGEAAKAMMGALAAMQRKMVAQSDWVGDRFASEARAIHLGEAAARSIHGRATRDEADSLIEDGVPVAPLPFPVLPPGEEN